jgi:hypothetical protein
VHARPAQAGSFRPRHRHADHGILEPDPRCADAVADRDGDIAAAVTKVTTAFVSFITFSKYFAAR